jgi:glycosyltransferase involved in cell wall biosynthesis
MKQYFFDVTDLRMYLGSHSQLSGIQRVSVMAIAKVRQEIDPECVWFSYHDRSSDTYWACPYPTDPKVDLTQNASLLIALNVRPSLGTLPGMAKYEGKPVKTWFHTKVLDWRAKFGSKHGFRRLGTDAQSWRKARATFKVLKKNKVDRFAFRDVAHPGDQLILLDNAWQPRGLETWLTYAKNHLSLDVTVLLHDLIPWVAPQYTTSTISERFVDWIRMSPSFTSRYLVNSENTASDLRDFLASIDATQDVNIVPLAQAPLVGVDGRRGALQADAHGDRVSERGPSIPDHIRAIVKIPYVLVVGTMEIRKNLWQLATVWDRLRGQTGRRLPKLVFAGRRGWLNNDFEALMEATGQLGGWVEIVEAPSDESLAYLYRNCLFTITASFYEGWGLPIGESLGYGKTAVVSNTASMPEVGGNMVEYCDPHCLDSIQAACLRLIDEPQHRAKLEERISIAHLRSWDEVVRDMLEVIKSSEGPKPS